MSEEKLPDQPSNKQAKRDKAQARADRLEELKAQQQSQRRKRGIVQGVAALVVVAVVIGVVVFVLGRNDDNGPSSAQDFTGATPTVSSDADGSPASLSDDGGFVVGNPDAPVTVTVVEDFQCPVCQQFEAQSGDQLASYAAGDDVKVEYRGIAFLDRMSSTDYSTRALNASACVMDSGADVWTKFHEQLFLQQPPEGGDGLPDDQLVSIAADAGADEAAVQSCVADGTFTDWTAATTQAAFDDGVSGTPTLFVNGKKLSSFDGTELQNAVDEAMGA